MRRDSAAHQNNRSKSSPLLFAIVSIRHASRVIESPRLYRGLPVPQRHIDGACLRQCASRCIAQTRPWNNTLPDWTAALGIQLLGKPPSPFHPDNTPKNSTNVMNLSASASKFISACCRACCRVCSMFCRCSLDACLDGCDCFFTISTQAAWLCSRDNIIPFCDKHNGGIGSCCFTAVHNWLISAMPLGTGASTSTGFIRHACE